MIVERIRQVVLKNQNRIAYKVNNDKITYKELLDKCDFYSKLLKCQGSSPVILYGGKEIDNYVAIFSCLFAGRAYVPLGLCTPIDRLKKIVKITGSNLIISDERVNIDGVDCIKLSELEKYKNFDEKVINNDIAYIIFTSGSTGEPKGVPITLNNLNNFIEWLLKLKPMCEYKNINVLNQANFSFDLSVADIYYSICNGHTLIAFDEDFNGIYEILKNENIDVAVMTPTLIKICLINHDFNEKNYQALKCIYFCGELLEIDTVKKIFNSFPNINIINAYGPTEATSAVCGIQITKEMLNDDLLPVGDIDNAACEIRIIDEEIVLKGSSVSPGYLDNIKGGFYNENGTNCYKTGDIGYIKNNKLYCKGRMDSQIKYKGYRIELTDIENNILKISGVNNCAVITKRNNQNVVRNIIAYVTGDNIDSDYINKELQKLIPGYMMPRVIKIIDKMPLNNNGKIDRKVLEEL